MAFTAGTYFEVQTGAVDTNGGGFDTGATFLADWAIASANTSAPVVTSASYNFIAGDVGGWFFLKSGTSSIPGWYIIVSVASNAATLNAAIGQGVLFNTTGTNGTPSTVLGCCTTGTSLSSITGGVDFSQQAATEIAYDDMIVGATTTQFTSVHFPVTKRIIGNIINVVSGATVQRVAVISTATTTATCDKSLGTAAQVGVGNLGGALLSLGLTGSLMVAGNVVFIKTGAYTVSSASTNVTLGCFASAVVNLRIEGYGTIRGDMGTPPTLTASGISTFVMIAMVTSGDWYVRNLILDGASLTSSRGITNQRGVCYKITGKNFTNGAFVSGAQTSGVLVFCSATGCATQPAIASVTCIDCQAYSNTVTGFAPNNAISLHLRCVSYNNTGSTSVHGFSSIVGVGNFWSCVAYGNAGAGFLCSVLSNTFGNCIAEANTVNGFNLTGNGNQMLYDGVFGNGVDVVNSGLQSLSFGLITATSTFFVNAAGGNFALNGTPTGGSLARAAGIPGLAPDGLSTGYLDIGAFQSPPMIPMARVFSGM